MKTEKIFNFEPTTDINEIKNYDGFIGPSGEFYKVSLMNKHNPTHIEWADEYVVKKLDFIKQLANPNGSLLYILSFMKEKQDLLINYYGYVMYYHNSYDRKAAFKIPNPDIAGKSITKKQKDVIWDICYANDELYALPSDFGEEHEFSRYQDMIDAFIVKRENERKMK